ncbi:MAG: hypothetical protein K2K92_02600, partial [Duncaniella sp.]|nr:hypothetical protein [Duncaniella sp.]
MRRKLFSLSAFYLSIAVAIIIIWWLSGAETDSQSGRSFTALFLKYFGDASLILLPFLILGRRFRWTALIPLWVIALWTLGSVWYYRFWGDLPGLSSLLLTGNLGSELLSSVLALWRPADIIYPSLPLLLTLAYCFGWRHPLNSAALTLPTKLAVVTAVIALFCVGQTVSSHIVRSYTASL